MKGLPLFLFLARAVAHLLTVLAHRITLLHGYHRGHLLFIDVVARPSYVNPTQDLTLNSSSCMLHLEVRPMKKTYSSKEVISMLSR